jgi:HEAT repeat protein
MGSDAIEMGAALVQIGIMSNNAEVREAAMDAIAKIDPEISKQVAIILNDKSEENRDKAVLTLSKMGKSAKSAAPAIKFHALHVASRNLQNSAKNPQYEAFEMIVLLSKIDPDDSTVSEMAMRAVAGNDKNIRLRRTGTETFRNEAIALLNSLNIDKNKKFAAIVLGISQTTVDKVLLINELGNLGEDASPAVKLLKKLKGDLDPKVRAAAEAALSKIGK